MIDSIAKPCLDQPSDPRRDLRVCVGRKKNPSHLKINLKKKRLNFFGQPICFIITFFFLSCFVIICFKKDWPTWLFCNWWRKEGRIPLKHFWYDSFGFWRVNWCLHDTPIASLVADFSSFYLLFLLTGAGGEGYLGQKNICTYIYCIYFWWGSPHILLSLDDSWRW